MCNALRLHFLPLRRLYWLKQATYILPTQLVWLLVHCFEPFHGSLFCLFANILLWYVDLQIIPVFTESSCFAGSEWHPRIQNEQNHFICNDLPQFIMDSYEECHNPPRLHLLDRYVSFFNYSLFKLTTIVIR